MKEFDKLTEAYMNIINEDRSDFSKAMDGFNKPFEKSKRSNLYTDILNPLHAIIGDVDHVSDALSNVDDLVHFLIQKNPSIKNDLIEYVKSKSNNM